MFNTFGQIRDLDFLTVLKLNSTSKKELSKEQTFFLVQKLVLQVKCLGYQQPLTSNNFR
jgi:hypothetical protein